MMVPRWALCALFGFIILSGMASGPAIAGELRQTDTADVTQSANAPAYRLKPSDFPLPAGAKPGDFRRMIQPFGPWTLICDENLKARTKICNASQTIIDSAGRLVFSWSLAATRTGEPVLILRVAQTETRLRSVRLNFGSARDLDQALDLPSCDAAICLGFLPVTLALKRAIASNLTVHIELSGVSSASPVAFNTTLEGLAAATAAIK